MSEIQRVSFTLEGLTPLLFHADDIEASDELQEWRRATENRDQSVKGDDRSPPWTWQAYLYSDGERLAWPSANIMAGLRQAGAKVILKGSRTFKEATQSGLFISEEFCPFEGGAGQVRMADLRKLRDLPYAEQAQAVKALGFRLWAKRARVGQAKHVRVRARCDKWKVAGHVEILDPSITFDVLERIFLIAGKGGLGDWRPACRTPGMFGQYEVSLKKAK